MRLTVRDLWRERSTTRVSVLSGIRSAARAQQCARSAVYAPNGARALSDTACIWPGYGQDMARDLAFANIIMSIMHMRIRRLCAAGENFCPFYIFYGQKLTNLTCKKTVFCALWAYLTPIFQ